MRVYLAGPEVFFREGQALIERKRALACAHGFEPAVGNPDRRLPDDPYEAGLAISAINEELMRGSDLIVANVTPFRGISADVGTVYELGFMCALGRPAFAYTNDPRHYDARAVAEWYGGNHVRNEDKLLGPDGQMIEDHRMADNLMIDGGVRARGGAVFRPEGEQPLPMDDLSILELCLATAAERLLKPDGVRGG